MYSSSPKAKTEEFLEQRRKRTQENLPGQIVPTFVEQGSQSSGGFEEVNEIRGQGGAPVMGDTPQPPTQTITYGAPSVWGGGGGGFSPAGVSHGGGPLVTLGGYRFASSVAPKIQALMRAVGGLRISSGYRDPAHNARVGGVPNSNHLTGRAADFSGSSGAMQRGAAWARANGAREVLIHNAGSGMHLHVAW